jgi:hypothetical protein
MTALNARLAAAEITAFFIKGEQFFPVRRGLPAGQPRARGAMELLLAGPTAAQRAKGIKTTIPSDVTLDAVTVESGKATVELGHAQTKPTAFDVSLRPARAAQIVYTLTAIPGIKRVLIRVRGVDRAQFEGSKLAVKGALNQRDLSRPITLPHPPRGVPRGPAPADSRGVQTRLVALRYLPTKAITGIWDYRTSQADRRRWPRSRRPPAPGRRKEAPAVTSRCTAARA